MHGKLKRRVLSASAPFDLLLLLPFLDAKCRNDKVQSGSGVINQASGSGSLSAMFWPERRCALNGFLRLDMIDARMGVVERSESSAIYARRSGLIICGKEGVQSDYG